MMMNYAEEEHNYNMADYKITQFTEDTAPSGGDYVSVVLDASGTPTNRKAKINNIRLRPIRYDSRSKGGDMADYYISIACIGQSYVNLGAGSETYISCADIIKAVYLPVTTYWDDIVFGIKHSSDSYYNESNDPAQARIKFGCDEVGVNTIDVRARYVTDSNPYRTQIIVVVTDNNSVCIG